MRTQCPASLQPSRSRASANRGETPARRLTTRESVFRVTPSRAAASETVQPSASIASRMISPGCAGSYIALTALPSSVVVDQVHVDGLGAVKSEHDSPVGRDPDTPEMAPLSLQLVETPAGESHVTWMGRFVQGSQNSSNPRHQIRVQSSWVATLIQPLEPSMNELHWRTVTRNVSRCNLGVPTGGLAAPRARLSARQVPGDRPATKMGNCRSGSFWRTGR